MPTPIPALALLALAPFTQNTDAIDRARTLVRRGQDEKAVEACRAVLGDEPENGEAWYVLGTALHALDDWDGAAQANLNAATHSRVYRGTALYNAACAQALGGKLDAAQANLERALAAGFLDFDLIHTDPDLDPLRARDFVDVPEPGTYTEYRARNGVRMRYRVLEPANLERSKPHPALVVFSPGSGPRSSAWVEERFFAGVETQEDWIVVSIVTPEPDGWFTHPAHHALEDVLDQLRDDYAIEGDLFHLFAFADGCGAATTYAGMSKKYWQSVTLASYLGWSKERDQLTRFRGKPVLAIAGALDPDGARAAEEACARLKEAGAKVSTLVLPEASLLLEGWDGRALFERLDRARGSSGSMR